jgi:hypothetical protein
MHNANAPICLFKRWQLFRTELQGSFDLASQCRIGLFKREKDFLLFRSAQKCMIAGASNARSQNRQNGVGSCHDSARQDGPIRTTPPCCPRPVSHKTTSPSCTQKQACTAEAAGMMVCSFIPQRLTATRAGTSIPVRTSLDISEI